MLDGARVSARAGTHKVKRKVTRTMTAKQKLRQLFLAGVLAVGSASAVHAQVNFVLQDSTPLARFGPIDAVTGYPLWIEDSLGNILEVCFDTTVIPDPLAPLDPAAGCPVCVDPLLDLPNANAPLSFPDNFTEEAFYMQATALMDTAGGGRAILVLALEAAFDGLGTVQDGEQIVFSRLRVRIDNAQGDQTYTVTHPYGVVDVTSAGLGPRGINITNDIFLWKQNLGGVLSGGIGNFGTFLQGTAPLANPDPLGAPFIGNPCGDSTVTGSPFGTNVFRIEGPNIGAPGSPFLCKDAQGFVTPTAGGPDNLSVTDCIETDLFNLVGKGASRFGADITRATYSRNINVTQVDVWAKSANDAILQASCNGIGSVPMKSDGAGNFYAHLAHSSAIAPPTSINVTNLSDNPPTIVSAPLVDAVAIPTAIYDLDAVDAFGNPAPTLTVTASSSRSDGGTQASLSLSPLDPANPPPPGTALSVDTTGSLTTSLSGVFVPPTTVNASSSFGGFDEVPVVVIAGVASPLAAAGIDKVAPFGSTVTLDGTLSAGVIDTYTWAQVANGAPTVTLTDAAVAPDPPGSVVTFTMPAGPNEVLLQFALTVSSGVGTSTDVMNVSSPIIANAGADQTVAAESIVTLDGCASTLILNTPSWTQTAGPAVVLSDPNICNPTFTMPLVGGTLTFELAVTGATGTAVDTVNVTGPAGVPVAFAGPPQTVFVGDTVQLDGGVSIGVIDTYTWTQLVGDPVQLGIVQQFGNIDFTLGSNVPNPAFVFPGTPQIMRFQLVVSGPGGTSTASTVDITGANPFVPDSITVSPGKAQYGVGKGEWRIEGLSTLPGPGNAVTMYLGPPLPANIIGTGIVDASGKFKVQATVPQSSNLDPTGANAAGNTLSATSSQGGSGVDLPFTIK